MISEIQFNEYMTNVAKWDFDKELCAYVLHNQTDDIKSYNWCKFLDGEIVDGYTTIYSLQGDKVEDWDTYDNFEKFKEGFA